MGDTSAVRGTARLVVHLVAASVRSFSASVRMNVLRTAGAGLLVTSEAIGAAILVDRFGGIGGWSIWEVLLLFGIADAGLGLGLLIAAPLDPPNFSQVLRDGRFDQALTRPVSPLLWTLVTDVQIRYLGRAAVGLALAAGAGRAAGVDVSPATVGLVTVAVVGMAATVVAVLAIGAAITMFTIEGTELLNSFTYGGATLAGWPLQIYDSALRAVFVFAVPIGATVYVPTLWLLDRTGPAGAGRGLLPAVPVLVAGFCAIATGAWRVGLRRYTGAGG